MPKKGATAEQWAEALGFAQKHATVEMVDGDRGGDFESVFLFGFSLNRGPGCVGEVRARIRDMALEFIQKRDAALQESELAKAELEKLKKQKKR